jgi:hypothetical protein
MRTVTVTMTKAHDDPTLDELIADPMTQAIMTADGVDAPALEAMLRSLARQIGGRPSATTVAAGRLARPVGARSDLVRAAERCCG